MKPKALLFDFDDTLGDREKYAYPLYRELIEKLAFDRSLIEQEALIQHCMLLDEQGDITKAHVRDVMLEKHGIDLGENLTEFWEANLNRFTVLFDDVIPTLEELKSRGYKLAIVTNGGSVGQRKKIERCGIAHYFDVITVSGDKDIHKPDPRIFLETAEALGVKPEECLMTGDIFYKDVLGAVNAGMDAVWMWSHGERNCSENVKKIRHIHELIDIIDALEAQ